MLKYCRGQLTDTNKLFSSFKSLKKYLSGGKKEVKGNLNRYCFMNFWKRTKDGITNRTNVHPMLGLWHADARTNMFFCMVKNLIGKMTHGRGEEKSEIWNYQKRKSSKIYKNFYRSKHLKQANIATIFR